MTKEVRVLKRFKRFIGVLAVLAVPMGAMAVEATPALAGNCTYVAVNNPVIEPDGIHVHGTPAFSGVIGNCTNVSLVEQYWPGYNDGAPRPAHITSNWGSDWNVVYVKNAYPCGGCLFQDPTLGNGATWVYYVLNGPCFGAMTQWYGVIYYRIQSIDIHGVKTWGPWHSAIGNWSSVKSCD